MTRKQSSVEEKNKSINCTNNKKSVVIGKIKKKKNRRKRRNRKNKKKLATKRILFEIIDCELN